MTKMLQRLLGETIALEFEPAAEGAFVLADSGMIEQVVMNLSVNARDAMTRGGRLSISIESIDVENAFIETHPQARPGPFVRLRVTDTGCGMDAETMSRIFEPFFTTKDIGQGTGLGLATVYGIVKQHDGWVEVTSELRKGSTFDVYFPASDEVPVPKKEDNSSTTTIINGKETVLIVEDEPVLRSMARDILEECGYRILEASSGKDALDLWNRRADEIDLVLTDMVMPDGVSGVDLAERLLVGRPGLRIVFTSGYTANEVNQEMLNRTGASFLSKPYTHAELAKAVRDCLDQHSQGNGALTANN
jgi:two-component system, cell cycle sensor histidine kinase and response regulator CckA